MLIQARVRALLLAVALVVGTGAKPAGGAVESLFISGQQTGSDFGAGTFSYLLIDSDFPIVGIEFDVTQPVAISQTGGVLRANPSASATLFSTVAPIVADRPVFDDLDASFQHVGLTDVTNSTMSTAHFVDVTQVANPGRYAVLFGTDRFGATGDALVLAEDTLINPSVSDLPFTILPTNARINQVAPILYAVFGSTLASPAAGIQMLGPEAFADAEVITFETGTTGLPTVPDVRFLDFLDPGNFYGLAGFDDTQFGEQAFSNASSVEYTDIGIEFTQPVESIGFYIKQGDLLPPTAGADTVTLRVLDPSGGLLYETDINIPLFDEALIFDEGKMFVGLSSDQPIGRVEWLSNDEGFFFVDNVSYNFVPEPASLALIGFGALGLLRRHRR